MCEPSGDHAGSATSSLEVVSRPGSPPLTGITYRSMCSPSRLDVNATRFPSGDHRGVASRLVPDVNRVAGAEPSTGASQIAPRYSFDSPSTLHTANAAVRPSGDSRGSATPLSSNTSSGVIPAMAAPPQLGTTSAETTWSPTTPSRSTPRRRSGHHRRHVEVQRRQGAVRIVARGVRVVGPARVEHAAHEPVVGVVAVVQAVGRVCRVRRPEADPLVRREGGPTGGRDRAPDLGVVIRDPVGVARSALAQVLA